ncbi:MAG: hypothetical protein HY690_10790 [Chloroflexi bacterium]|nr:hypothetical protein [Chloroflexota bacterium]
MTPRNMFIAVGAIILFAVLGSVIARPSADAPQASEVVDVGDGTPGSQPASKPQPAQKTDRNATPQAQPGPSPTPREIDRAGIGRQQPLLLLNPASAKPSSSVGVAGGGFDGGATIDLFLKRSETDPKPQELGFVQADQSGAFGSFSFNLPADAAAGSFVVEARQRNSGKAASSNGQIAGDVPQIKMGTQVGQPGNEIAFAASGFAPGETVGVFWNSLAAQPVATFRVDQGGTVRQAAVRVPFGAVGMNSFIFIGEKSQSPVTVPFQMLNLYPVVDLSSYALKADQVMAFSGKGFGPGERVLVYLNSPNGQPIGEVVADGEGSFTNAGPFRIPFDLKGKNTFIFIGQQSLAPTTASFDILPYTPSVQPSTYGGRPGTSLSFYATGFARDEVVRVFVGKSQNSAGRLVSCFKTDDQGNALAAGQYTVPGNVQAGTAEFNLVGARSQAAAVAAFEVMEAGGPVQVAAEDREFRCPFDDQEGQDGRPQPAPGGQPQAQAQPTQGAQPQPQAQGQATPGAQAQGQGQPARTVVVANTDGQGVVLRRTPAPNDRTNVAVAEGRRLQVLETKQVDQTTWLHVRTEDGTEGWVPAQYAR